jgi:hypothetical protein
MLGNFLLPDSLANNNTVRTIPIIYKNVVSMLSHWSSLYDIIATGNIHMPIRGRKAEMGVQAVLCYDTHTTDRYIYNIYHRIELFS